MNRRPIPMELMNLECITKYVNIPPYYEDLKKDIYSINLQRAFSGDLMNFLRKLYIQDNEQFYNTRDELLLRGFSFKQPYQNNYLPELPYTIKHVLYKQHNTKAYKNINFSLMGLKNFIERFNITSDLFFCGLPLEGILYFSRNTSQILIEKVFEEHGFSIIPVDEFSMKQKELESSTVSPKEETKNINSTMTNDEKTAREAAKIHDKVQPLLIEKVFEDQEFYTFRRYCRKNNVTKISQLTIDFIERFKHEKYIREKTMLHVKAVYEALDQEHYNFYTNSTKLFQQLAHNPFKQLYEKYISPFAQFLDEFYEAEGKQLYDAHFPFHQIESLNEQLVEKIQLRKKQREKAQFQQLTRAIKEHPFFKFIEQFTISDINKIIAPNLFNDERDDLLLLDVMNDRSYLPALKNLLTQLECLQPIDRILTQIQTQIDTRDAEILRLRQSKTLQEIGDLYDLSRERVRQILTRTNKKIKGYKSKVKLSLYIQYFQREKSRFIDIKDFMPFYNLSGEMNEVILSSLFDQEKTLTYVKALDLYLDKEDYAKVQQAIAEVGEGRSIIRLEEFKEVFTVEELNEYKPMIDRLLAMQNYKYVDPIYVKKNVNIIDRVNYLFKYVFDKPLEMNEEGFTYFKKVMEETFDMPFTGNRRSAAARIADGENIILVDSNTFYYYEPGLITETFIDFLAEEITKQINIKDVANPRDIYAQYKEKMIEMNIQSPLHLYSIIQMYLDDQFEIGHGNTLNIYKANAKRLDSETLLLNYLERHGNEVSKDQFLRDLKWKEHKLDQLLNRIDSVLQIDQRTLKTVASFNFDEADLQQLKEAVYEQMTEGYLFINDLQFELAFNESLEKIVKKYGLTKEVTLISVLKWLMPKLQGHSKLLYVESSPVKKLEEAIAKQFPTLATRQEIINFIEEKGYSIQTVHQMLHTLLHENYFYHYTTTQLINVKQLNFTDDVKVSLANYLKDEMKETDYLSVYQMRGFSQVLRPISTYEWTEWLIYQLAEKVGYTPIVDYNDYRYNQLILVKDELDIHTFDRLVLHIVNHEYEGRYHEKDLARYLEAKNLLHNPYQLPKVIKESRYFTFDEFGFFEIRSV